MSDRSVQDPQPEPLLVSEPKPVLATAHASSATGSETLAGAPADVALLLRAHAERSWLSREVIPVVRQIEATHELPSEQRPAALAYLEVVWAEALGRARETDAERARLEGPAGLECPTRDVEPLLARARRQHAGVRTLREAVASRVALLI